VVIADVEAVVVAGRLLCSPVCTTVDPWQKQTITNLFSPYRTRVKTARKERSHLGMSTNHFIQSCAEAMGWLCQFV
jgi:hypothetical protein